MNAEKRYVQEFAREIYEIKAVCMQEAIYFYKLSYFDVDHEY